VTLERHWLRCPIAHKLSVKGEGREPHHPQTLLRLGTDVDFSELYFFK